MAKTQISIPLEIPDVKVLQTEFTKAGELIITIASTKTEAVCHRCGRAIRKVHGYEDWVVIRYLPVFERNSYLRYRPRRYYCADCDATTTQQVEWHEPNSPHSRA
jgi:transposase